jgi:hypothetical protein
MPDYAEGIDEFNLNLSFGVAHPGQNFSSIDDASFKLKFFKVGTHAGFLEAITPVSYLLTFVTTPGADLMTHSVSIIPASFTLKTSRTDPLEPQPVV